MILVCVATGKAAYFPVAPVPETLEAPVALVASVASVVPVAPSSKCLYASCAQPVAQRNLEAN